MTEYKNNLENNFYIQDVDFPSGYNTDQSPIRMSCVAALGGYSPPLPDSNYTYIDIGCGNGITLNILASVNPQAHFIGIDFNDKHIAEAKDFAFEAKLDNVEYIQTDFIDLLEIDIQKAEYIAMNGIYSWLHPKVLEIVVSFLQNSLQENGLFYVQTMTLPGKAPIAPIWYLMRQMTNQYNDSSSRFDNGMELMSSLHRNNIKFFHDNPLSSEIMNGFLKKRYQINTKKNILHHALSDNWRPLYITELNNELKKANINFAGSTIWQKNDISLCIPKEMEYIFSSIDQPIHRELLKDFILNSHNRYDIFACGEPQPDQALNFLAKKIFFFRRQEEAVHKLKHSIGGLRFEYLSTATPFQQILLEEREKPINMEALLKKTPANNFSKLKRELIRLLSSNTCFLCLTSICESPMDPKFQLKIHSKSHILLIDKAMDQWTACLLPSPITREGCISLSPIESLILKANVTYGPDDMIDYLYKVLSIKQDEGYQLPQNILENMEVNYLKIQDVCERNMNSTKFRNLSLLGIIRT